MLSATYPFWLASRAVQPNTDLAVLDKHTGAVATRVAQASASDIDAAFQAAAAAAPAMAAMPAHQRRDVLLQAWKLASPFAMRAVKSRA